jgi:hypothetical protein
MGLIGERRHRPRLCRHFHAGGRPGGTAARDELAGGAGDRRQHCRLHVVDGLGVRGIRQLDRLCRRHFAFFLAMPLWYLARRRRDVRDVAGGSRQGGQRRADIAGRLWRHHLGDAGNAMGAVSALRETSVVFAALLGAMFLGERLTGLRIAACCIIAAGAACVGWHL